MSDLVLTLCPVCRAINIVTPGKPPGIGPYDFYNRCSCHALTGEPGKPGPEGSAFSFEHSWRKPQRSSTRLCGAALTDECGEVISPISLDEFIAITGKPFKVKQLTKRVLETSQE